MLSAYTKEDAFVLVSAIKTVLQSSAVLHKPTQSVLQVGTQLLFVGEVYAWFCVGEVIGRGGSLSGYNI